jgi:hypothetical protein
MNHISRQKSGEHTFDHLDIVRNEADIILNFKARMSRILEDKVTGAYMGIDLHDRQFYNDQLRTFLDDGRLDICFGGVNSNMGEAIMAECSQCRPRKQQTDLRITSRCAKTPFKDSNTGVYVAAGTSVLGLHEKRRVQTRNRYDLLDEPTLGTRISFSCLLVFHRKVF